jgi:hypothetical protein
LHVFWHKSLAFIAGLIADHVGPIYLLVAFWLNTQIEFSPTAISGQASWIALTVRLA